MSGKSKTVPSKAKVASGKAKKAASGKAKKAASGKAKAAPGKEDMREIICDEVMDISTVAEMKLQLVEALGSGLPIILDAKQVERADTAALQVLAAFFHDAVASEINVQWRDPSEALARSSTLLGLSELLNLENVLH